MTGFLYGHQGKRRKLKRAAGRIFRKMREMVIYALLVLIGLFLCSPVLLLLSGSITGDFCGSQFSSAGRTVGKSSSVCRPARHSASACSKPEQRRLILSM